MVNDTVVLKQVTAFQALTIVENDANMTEWKSTKKNVYMTDISSESCDKGLSSNWIVTYVLDSQEALVQVDDGLISVNMTMATSSDSRSPKLNDTGLIDSDKAISIADGMVSSAQKVRTGPPSIELIMGEGSVPMWDIMYPVQDGQYLLRLNAMNGQLVGSAQFS